MKTFIDRLLLPDATPGPEKNPCSLTVFGLTKGTGLRSQPAAAASIARLILALSSAVTAAI
jgi:hypothetical protein